MRNHTPDDCWNRIGSLTEGTCPNLEEFVHCRNCPVFSREGRALLDRAIPREYLAEWTAVLAREKQVEAGDRVSMVVFRLHHEWLAIETHVFEKIVSLRPIHSVPHRSNSLLLGLANIKGELLLCVSLGTLLGIEEAEPEKAESSHRTAGRLIVIHPDNEPWAFPVDEVEGIHRFSAHELEKVPSTVTKAAMAYSRGIFQLGSRRVAFLDEQLVAATLKRSVRW